ncbi:MAG: 50S ribosomal protein L9 [Ignavibacteria bacterium]|nr:50S ribosomal protein L9 [Ignavibacteria bacterium]
MKIILRKDYEVLGKKGEIVSVKDGFARNYLFPQKIAALATESTVKAMELAHQQMQAKVKKELLAVQKRVSDLQKISQVTIAVKVGEENRLFGSVTSLDIANALKAHHFDLDKRAIELDEPIKSLGIYSVHVKLHSEVKTTIKVKVVKE